MKRNTKNEKDNNCLVYSVVLGRLSAKGGKHGD